MKLKSVLKKIKRILINTFYYNNYYNRKLKDNMIFIESKNGGDLAGNMFHILKEVTGADYSSYTVRLSCRKSKKGSIKGELDSYGIKNVKFVKTDSLSYYKHLATAKYLFTDTSFVRMFIKKEGQIITNTWHGTPLKKMGRDVENRAYAMGNVQRNLLSADYLVYPNDYMMEKMVEAYELKGLYEGTILCEGYPRNSVFFDKEVGQDIKKELGLTGKQVFIYMPTWRGTMTRKSTGQLMVMLYYYLMPLDEQLKDNQVLYVKLHPFVSKDMDYSRFRHIQPYPDQYDTYEFMNMCDCLITDYSSVFYDYANSGKKIILFAYDETQYIRERGLYVNLNDYPFPVVKKLEELVYELNTPKNYDDREFLKECCTYDGPGAAGRICRHVIKGEKVCKELKLPKNGKENVLIFNGALTKNGLTTSMNNLFNHIDLSKKNYYLTFLEEDLRKGPARIKHISREIGILPMSSGMTRTIRETMAHILYFKFDKDTRFSRKYLDRLYKREIQKHFGSIHLDFAIQFAGYNHNIINLFERFDCPKFIFVHNDMVEEIKTRSIQHYLTLRSAYRNYDKVAVVTKDIVEPTVKISGTKENIVVVNNCHAHNEVIEKAAQPVSFDEETKSNVPLKELQEILDSDARKFITIGRFSPEKGHMMLMKAYERFDKKYPGTYLIIIGGHGGLYRQTLSYANNSDANIIIIKSMKNPMPILNKCNFFMLSSYYEGLGLTLLEADALGIPTMSTDVQGPRGFVGDHGGVLVEATEDGLLKGMMDYMQGKIKAMGVDYDEYNKDSVKQFEQLFVK